MKCVEAFIQPHRLSTVVRALIAQTIAAAAHTHNPGEGLVSVSDVSQVLRIADAGESQ
jgi:nitrogen regulatory protein PII